MNYEKLSRGLRYYYDKNIIHKTAGKRYVKNLKIKVVGKNGNFTIKLFCPDFSDTSISLSAISNPCLVIVQKNCKLWLLNSNIKLTVIQRPLWTPLL